MAMLTQNNPHCTFSKLLARRPSTTTADLPKLSISEKVSIINPEMNNINIKGGGGEGLSKIETIERFRSIKTRFPTPYPEKKAWLSDEEVPAPIK